MSCEEGAHASAKCTEVHGVRAHVSLTKQIAHFVWFVIA